MALGDQRREFLQWLLEIALEDGVGPDSIITPQARDFLVERLSTPFQFAEHLNRAFTDAFNLGAEKVSREIVENTLSAGFDSLDVKLARIGYTPKALAERFDAHPTKVRRFLNRRLDAERTAELGDAWRNAGIPCNSHGVGSSRKVGLPCELRALSEPRKGRFRGNHESHSVRAA